MISYNNTSSQDKSIPGSGRDPKFLIQIIEEFNALSKNPVKLLEYVNASADYGRYVLGINVMPASWQLRDGELKFIPHGTWKEYQDNPIPEQTHQEWKNTGAFLRGIAGILGKVFHRPDKVGYYLSQVDMDNAPAISEIIRWKGDKSLAEFGKRGLVTQHTAKLDSSAKIYIYSKTPLKNKDPDVSKDDTNLPSWEIHCLGRMAIMPGSRHRKNDPVIITKDGVLEPITLSDETEQRTFEEYSNNLCIKYGLNPYLYNGHGNGNGKSTSSNGYRDTEPLEPEIQRMLFKVGNYDENVVINQDHRHVTMVKVANSILWTYSDDEQFTDDIQPLKDWFILINDHCCKLPLEISERDRIWSDTVDYVGKQKSLQNQCILTVSDAIREQPGANKSVRGTIFSVSAIFKVATQLYYRCSCGSVIGSPIKGISLYWEKYLDRRCPSCNEEGLNLDFNASKFNDAKIVVLQNVDLTSDLDETLEVLLLGEHTKDVKAGEIVVVRGSLKYGPSNLGRHSKNKKTIALLTAKFLNYEGRQNIAITESNIKSFHRFARLNQHIDVIQRLVNMTAPNVIGEEPYKLGVLRSVVGGLDSQRRGRIHTLSVGDKGLAKSLVMREATKMKPNARMITAHSASSTSALGIIDSTNDVKTLIYGPIPLSSGSIVGIDELQSWTHDNQGILLNVMEEGRFGLLKYARDKSIIAETTIIATANPQDIEYDNRDSISVREINLLAPLRDRFDQIYIALDEIDEQKDWEYSENRIKYTRTRKLHNYNFITKYLIYAEDIKPELTREARVMLQSFWIELRKQKLSGRRMLESIFRIAEATAKLRLKNTIDVNIALEVQESVQVMQTRLGQYVKTVQDPRDIAIEEIDKVVENIQAGILFEEAVKVVVGENQRVRSWLLGGLNKKLNATHNKRFRELYDRYVQHIKQPNSKILILKMKPLTIVWQTAKSVTATAKTITASDINDLNDSNDLSNINNISENQPENGSDNSYQTSGVEITENQNLSKNEMRSFGSFGSFGNDPNSTDKVVTYTDNIAYEYLEQVKAYRCLQCRCIYYKDTKDSYESHPCNGLGKSKGVVN